MERSERLGPTPEEKEWIWAEMGPGPFCCEAQADGVPCFELGKDCTECDLGREGWLKAREAARLREAGGAVSD